MYLVENPVLQRELLVNLRMARGFFLLLLYQGLLGLVVFFAWPQVERLDLTQRPDLALSDARGAAGVGQARRLVDMFFLGQYMLACLMAPSFAGGAITGEKERKTYEMLLASPLKPAAIVAGKLVASLTHLAVLIFSSLPIVVLCLPLGGVSVYEVLAAYLGLIMSVITFGMISIACSSYFQRTASALVVSYLLILPLAMLAVFLWYWLSSQGSLRLYLTLTILPATCAVMIVLLFLNTSARLLHPPDVGSEGQEVVDLDEESENAIGLVIQPDQFPDRLFAPAKRHTLMEDGANPVYDKEVRSEIFSQGTLMLRVVIQVSIVLALPLMGYCLFLNEKFAPWYIAYVLLFNMLVGPVFSSGSVTSERERQTLDLLLTTIITPWQILTGKLFAGLRISSVLTLMLMWPLLLAAVMVPSFWSAVNWGTAIGYVAVVGASCLMTAGIALTCSVVFHKTAHSLLVSYLVILVLYCAPLAVAFFAQRFYPEAQFTQYVDWLGAVSPVYAVFEMPLTIDAATSLAEVPTANWWLFSGHLTFSLLLDAALLGAMMILFHRRWRVAD